jgi:hypothetical protein
MAQPTKKMVVGFNHNINYKGRVYHVQTEDSGIGNPHLITHLFVGGNILASKKSSYAHLLAEPNLEKQVQELMEAQHKEMLRTLVAGGFEHLESDLQARSFQPGELAETRKAPPLPVVPVAPPPPVEKPPSANNLVETLFAEDLISEKSLDEVILRYLTDQIGK